MSRPGRLWAIWDSERMAKRLWQAVCGGLIVSQAITGWALVAFARKEREVVRIGCDGVPALLTVDENVYQEPDEREIKAFAAQMGMFLMRRDSFSVRQDWAHVARFMVPRLYARFTAEAQGTRDQPGLTSLIEGLEERTNVPVESLEVGVDKTRYPWLANVKGIRQVVGKEKPQTFEVTFSLERASRNHLLAGLVISDIQTRGEAVAAPAADIDPS